MSLFLSLPSLPCEHFREFQAAIAVAFSTLACETSPRISNQSRSPKNIAWQNIILINQLENQEAHWKYDGRKQLSNWISPNF